MSWRLAESLKKLREQINAAYPKRDKTSDGSIGDAAHASRNSDHNPWVFDGKQGVVTAIDIDEDLNGGKATLEEIVTAIRKSRDPRVKYIIYEGRITVAGSNLQRWKKYTGKNAHKQHAHISVHSDRKLYDSRAEWSIGVTPEPPPLPPIPDPEPEPTPPVAVVPATPTPPADVPVEVAAEPAPAQGGTEIVSGAEPPPEGDNKVKALIPHMDTAKGWFKWILGGGILANAVAWFSEQPTEIRIALMVLFGLIVAGIVYAFIKYNHLVFGFVSQALNINADPDAPNVQLVADRKSK